jgi:hypothetical protein
MCSMVKRPKWFNQRQYMPIQPRPSHHQIRTLWKPMCHKIKQQISMGNISLGQWTRTSMATRPHCTSYVKLTTKPPTYYHWIQDAYWSLKPYLQSVQGVYITDHSTTWRPTDTSIPILISHSQQTLQGTVFNISVQDQSATIQPDKDDAQNIPQNTLDVHDDDFRNYIQHLLTWQRILLQETKF